MNRTSARTLSVLFLALAAGADAVAAISFHTVSTTALPNGVTARDVRWAGPTDVYVSLGKQGVVRMPIGSMKNAVAVMPAGDRGGFHVSGRLGAGKSHLVVSSGMGGIGWIPLAGSGRKVGQLPLLTVMDIDAHGDKVAILGADSGPVMGLAGDGTIAWTGSLAKGLSDMRPLMRGRSKPGGKDMARCSILETGAIRFMPDGSLIVVPGSEPGIYRYDANGKLLKTWDTEPLGIVDDCDLNESQMLQLSRDFGERIKWYSSRIILDEILPLANGPGLLLRRVDKGTTKWDVVMLPSRGGRSERVTLPLTMPTPRAHVRGDVRGGRLVLIAFDDPLPGQQPVAPPKLVVMSIAQ